LLRRFFLFLVFVVLVAAGAGAFVLLVPAGPRAETFVDINPGMSTMQIATALKQQGIIWSKDAFLGLYVVRGLTLKAGEDRQGVAAEPGSSWIPERPGNQDNCPRP